MAATARAAPPVAAAEYRIALDLDPARQALRASAVLSGLPCEQGRLVLHLNRQLTLDAAEVDGRTVPVEVEPPDVAPFWLSNTRSLRLPCPQSEVRLRYHGAGPLHRDGRNQITPALTELSVYGAWYPLTSGGEAFRWSLTLNLPADAHFFSNASQVEGGEPLGSDRRWRLQQAQGGRDIALVASAGFTASTARAEGTEVLTLVGSDRSAAALDQARRLGHLAAERLSALVSLLGPPVSGPPPLRAGLVFSRRDGPLSYARLPMVVIPQTALSPDPEDERPTELNLLHELVHFWTRAAAPEDDWLNEGLAEYLALRELARSGQDALAERQRQRYRQLAQQAGAGVSIRDTGRSDRGTLNRYYKPALLFDLLEREAGSPRMERFLRAVLAADRALSTERVLGQAAAVLGEEAARRLRNCLVAADWPASCGGLAAAPGTVAAAPGTRTGRAR